MDVLTKGGGKVELIRKYMRNPGEARKRGKNDYLSSILERENGKKRRRTMES